MGKKGKAKEADEKAKDIQEQEELKTCFVIMPITDREPYEKGHFQRVYTKLIKPVCAEFGFQTTRADEVASTNHIVLDILERIHDADIVVCDLSAKNPNVMFELGIRQAFDKPVVLLKDDLTERVFDISGLRSVDYSSSLRIDLVELDREDLRKALEETRDKEGKEVNSLVKLLAWSKAAELPSTEPPSEDAKALIPFMRDLETRMRSLEDAVSHQAQSALGEGLFPERWSGLSAHALRKTTARPSQKFVFDHEGNQLGLVKGLSGEDVVYEDETGALRTAPQVSVKILPVERD